MRNRKISQGWQRLQDEAKKAPFPLGSPERAFVFL